MKTITTLINEIDQRDCDNYQGFLSDIRSNFNKMVSEAIPLCLLPMLMISTKFSFLVCPRRPSSTTIAVAAAVLLIASVVS